MRASATEWSSDPDGGSGVVPGHSGLSSVSVVEHGDEPRGWTMSAGAGPGPTYTGGATSGDAFVTTQPRWMGNALAQRQCSMTCPVLPLLMASQRSFVSMSSIRFCMLLLSIGAV